MERNGNNLPKYKRLEAVFIGLDLIGEYRSRRYQIKYSFVGIFLF